MNSKPGYLKESKNVGQMLQNIGHTGADIFGNPMVERGFETVGQVMGSMIPIPIVGGQIGKQIGESIANTLSYGSGLVGEIGGMISGEKNIGDVLSYIPNRVIDKVTNSDVGKVIRGEMNWRDAVLNNLEENAMINFLAPGKTHAWKDDQGNYHKEYVDGATMVVGSWQEQPNTQPRPDPSSNNIKIGPNGEVIRNGF